MDDESEDELDALAELMRCDGEEEGPAGSGEGVVGGGEAGAHRFALLKQLWAR